MEILDLSRQGPSISEIARRGRAPGPLCVSSSDRVGRSRGGTETALLAVFVGNS